MKTFATYYKTLPLNKRINLKGIGAMLNPWFTQTECPFDIKNLQSLDISFARVVHLKTFERNDRVFFTIDWSNPIRRSFDVLNSTCRSHYKRSHSMYPANSFDYLNLGTSNH